MPVILDVTPSTFDCDDVGPNEVTLTVSDASGNSSTCTAIVTVQDNGNLQAICQNLVVQLDQNGMVSITAVQVNNGSGGGCNSGMITLSLDVMDFDCSDVGPNIVVLTVTDQADNTATCTATITVQDNIPPDLICPPDVTTNCDNFDPNNLGPFGVPSVSDNCPGVIVTAVNVDNRDLCGAGTFVRTFTATDASGNTDQCVQVITIENADPFTEDDIVWPAAVINLPECSSTDPDDIPNSQPVINLAAGNCSNVTVTFSDDVTMTCDTLPNTPCIVVERTWTVTDSCQLPAGVFTFEQTINVNDNTGPMFSSINDITVTADENTCTGIVNLVASATACGVAVAITNDFNMGGANASGEYPIGTTTVTFTAEDDCCNVSTLEVDVTVENPNPLQIQCDKLIFNMTIELVIPIAAEEFITIIPGSCVDPDDYFFSYSSTNPFDSVQDFDCSFTGTVTPILIYTFDPNLMPFDTCQGDFDFRDSFNFCGSALTVTGEIFSEGGVVLQEVPVDISNPQIASTTTSTTGRYAFKDLPFGESISVTPFLDENPRAGLSTLDLITIQKHLLGLSDLESPYQMIAADANRSGSLSAIDLLEIRRLLLGVIPTFSQNTSWRFVDAGFDFPDPFNPFMTEFPEHLDFYEMTEHHTGADFVGIKIGDVNNSLFNVSGGVLDVNASESLTLYSENAYVNAGQAVLVPVRVRDFHALAGLQFAMHIDPSRAELIAVRQTGSEIGEQMLFAMDHMHEAGSFTANWFAPEGHDMQDGEVLFVLELRVLRTGTLSQILSLDTEMLDAETYVDGVDVTPAGLDLQLMGAEKGEDLILMQNRPNPFSGITEIPFYLPETDRTTFMVYDLNGKVIVHREMSLTSGFHVLELSASELQHSGIYYYKIMTSTGEATGKMSVLR